MLWRLTLVLAALTPGDLAAADTLTVMSYNVRYGTAQDGDNAWPNRRDILIDTIKSHDPDLLGTQETLAFQRDEMAKALPHLTPFGVGRDDGKGSGEQATLLYRTDRFKQLAGGNFWLSATPEAVGSRGWDAALPRIATWVKLADARAPDAPPILFLNTHFDHVGRVARRESAALVRAKLGELGAGCRLVVTGDFNAPEASPPYLAMFADDQAGNPSPVVDCYRVPHPERTDAEGTFNGFRPDATKGGRIDWVAASRDLAVTSAAIDRRTVHGKLPSDHYPVVVRLAPQPTVLAPYTKPTCIAHRGASASAPEHTLAAYRLALEYGADYVEPDLQLTKDGVLICLHDTTLERTTDAAERFPDRAVVVRGKKTFPVADFTLAEVKTLDAGRWKDAKFAGERVPTLDEMLDLVVGKAGVIPETKAPEVYAGRGLDMERALMTTLAKRGLDKPGADPKTPVVIQSFSAESLKKLKREHNCRLPLVYLIFQGDVSADAVRGYKSFADGLAPNKDYLLANPDLVRLAHAEGMSVTVWTCRAGRTGKFPDVKAEMRYLLNDLKVDAIFTDNPEEFPRD